MLSTPVCYLLTGKVASVGVRPFQSFRARFGMASGKAVSFYELNHLSALLASLNFEKEKALPSRSLQMERQGTAKAILLCQPSCLQLALNFTERSVLYSLGPENNHLLKSKVKHSRVPRTGCSLASCPCLSCVSLCLTLQGPCKGNPDEPARRVSS